MKSETNMMPNSSQTLPRANRWRTPLIILAILALGAAAAGAALWWHNRPIKATILTAEEKTTRQQKLAVINQAQDDPEYVPGKKEIILTERELNGLIHENTALGEQLKLELARNAIHARINANIPDDFPIMAGKKLKGKARFIIQETNGSPALILDDVTIWGISIPNAWLGGLKGQNLLGEVLSPNGGSLIGLEELSIANRSLVIKLAD